LEGNFETSKILGYQQKGVSIWAASIYPYYFTYEHWHGRRRGEQSIESDRRLLSKSQLIAFTLVLLAAGSATLAAPTADYPIKPIRIITAEPGGVNDITTRMIAQELTSSLHQQVVVDNRGGAGGAIAAKQSHTRSLRITHHRS